MVDGVGVGARYSSVAKSETTNWMVSNGERTLCTDMNHFFTHLFMMGATQGQSRNAMITTPC